MTYFLFASAGTSWTVIQNRVDGSLDFNQTWDAYDKGFGDLNGKKASSAFFALYKLIWEAGFSHKGVHIGADKTYRQI